MANSMVHWNGHQMCVIDTETTGLDPSIHEMIQVCILPLDSDCQPRQDIIPFYIELKPDNPEAISKEAMKVTGIKVADLLAYGIDRFKAIDLFEVWYKKLGLPTTRGGYPKRIMPLGQNYAFDKAFMMKWLGFATYEEYFFYHYRDTMIAALYLNDHAAVHGEEVPFKKVNLSWLAKQTKTPLDRAHDALHDCLATAGVYRQLLRRGLV